MDLEQQARRIQAAQALGGFSSVEKLYEEMVRRESRVKFKRLRALWRGNERGGRPELSEIADACGLPYAFFTVDFNRLPDLVSQNGGQAEPLAQQVDALRADLELLSVEVRRLSGASGRTSQDQGQ